MDSIYTVRDKGKIASLDEMVSSIAVLLRKEKKSEDQQEIPAERKERKKEDRRYVNRLRQRRGENK